ncbi:hypothetical protein PG990_000259 [Apiospora arundinis]|uniref:DUF6594 domain-containing protein n=1 Tax=Apiospora arundinis TaxID=335852 RepID=A0ABR2HYQ9_9PEZI
MEDATQPIGMRPLNPAGGDNFGLLPTPKRSQARPKKFSEHPELYSDDDVKAYARTGLSWIAARQRFYPNEDNHREFGFLSKRVLLDLAQRLGCLELELLRMEGDEDKETLRQFQFDRDAYVARCKGLPDPSAADDNHKPTQEEIDRRKHMTEKENLLYHIRVLKKEYYECLIHDREIQAMSQISHKQHYALYEKIADKHKLTPSAAQFLLNMDDFVTPNNDLLHQRFEGLLYTTKPFLSQISGFFRRYFCSLCRCFNRPAPSPMPGQENGDAERDYNARILKWLSRFILAPTVAVFLLVPVAILFFGNLTKAAEFGVVLTFVALFVLAISCFERSTVKIIIGVCAFEAVLAAFLAK